MSRTHHTLAHRADRGGESVLAPRHHATRADPVADRVERFTHVAARRFDLAPQFFCVLTHCASSLSVCLVSGSGSTVEICLLPRWNKIAPAIAQSTPTIKNESAVLSAWSSSHASAKETNNAVIQPASPAAPNMPAALPVSLS